MDYYAIITKLIGPINATGESQADSRRFSNLCRTCDLIEGLMDDIETASGHKNNHQASMKKIGKKARKFLDGLQHNIQINN